MKRINNYILEKFKISKDIKVNNISDISEFIESFSDDDERRWIKRLVGWCAKHLDKRTDDHECYVVEYIKDINKSYTTLTALEKFGWSDNTAHEHHEVGDIAEYGGTKYKIIFIVTKDTVIPEKYK